MSDRLNTVLEDGRLEQLRIMAGGQRKVGAYLSDVIAWLWYHREQLQTAPLSDFAPILQEWIPRIVMSPEEQAQQAEESARQAEESARLNAELGQWRERMAELDRKYAELNARIEAWGDARDAVLATQQQDSNNDA